MVLRSFGVFLVVLGLLARGLVAQGADSNGDFQTVDGHKSNTVRVDKGADWSRYTVVRFVHARYEPANAKHGLRDCDAVKLEEKVDASLASAFQKGAASEGAVVEVRPVITDVKRARPWVNVVSFLALQVVVSYGAASVRYELVDGVSGKKIGEIASSRSARPWTVYPWQILDGFEPLGHGELILKQDSKQLRRDLNKLAALAVKADPPAVAGAE